MCGRFARFTSIEKIIDYYKIDEVLNISQPSYNITPSSDILAIIKEQNKRKLRTFKWGFVPSWNLNLKPVINARIETLKQKPYFKKSIHNKTLIIADGFFEWKDKQPYYIYRKDKKPMLFGGIYDNDTCAIITTTPNRKISQIHDRMPLIVLENFIEEFFKSEDFLNFSIDEEILDFCKVSKAINNPKNNYKELINCI
ncbi:MAG: SOS response-associated peptidase [candidate division WOR-3 bacterium]|jgi:putative SOS response-associated peptidase YedK